jgi:hypothetical protein
MCFFFSLTRWYELVITNSLIQGWTVIEFPKYVGSFLEILSISHGDRRCKEEWMSSKMATRGRKQTV